MSKQTNSKTIKTSIGGQAVIEGVMTVSYTHLTLPTTSRV